VELTLSNGTSVYVPVLQNSWLGLHAILVLAEVYKLTYPKFRAQAVA
jgi:hypothetical protein